MMPEASVSPGNQMPDRSQLETMNLTTWHLARQSLPQGAGNGDTFARRGLTVPDYRA